MELILSLNNGSHKIRIVEMKKLLLSLVVIGSTSCAGAFGPVNLDLAEEGYFQYSLYMYGVESCMQSGEISPELAGQGMNGLTRKLSVVSYDRNKLTQMYKKRKEDFPIPNSKDCDRMEMITHQYIGEGNTIARNQANRPVQTYVTPAINKPLWCNTVGTVTMCN
jgi:hypothetical protein